MHIFLAADHRGFQLKEDLKLWLEQQSYSTTDVGNHEYDAGDDFPDFVIPAANQVAQDSERGARGIVLCGSGAGAVIAANKVKGIRASIGLTVEQVESARADDDINVLVIAADYTQLDRAREMIAIFLATEFKNEERHVRRLNKIKDLEK